MNRYFFWERIKSIIVAILMLPAGLLLVCGGLGLSIIGVEGDGERSWFLVIIGVVMLLYGIFAVWNSYWGVNEDVERNKRYSKEIEEKNKAARAAMEAISRDNIDLSDVRSDIGIGTGKIQNNKGFIHTEEKEITEIPVDEMRTLKMLLDEGVLNEEEYEEKKKQLLGL